MYDYNGRKIDPSVARQRAADRLLAPGSNGSRSTGDGESRN